MISINQLARIESTKLREKLLSHISHVKRFTTYTCLSVEIKLLSLKYMRSIKALTHVNYKTKLLTISVQTKSMLDEILFGYVSKNIHSVVDDSIERIIKNMRS